MRIVWTQTYFGRFFKVVMSEASRRKDKENSKTWQLQLKDFQLVIAVTYWPEVNAAEPSWWLFRDIPLVLFGYYSHIYDILQYFPMTDQTLASKSRKTSGSECWPIFRRNISTKLQLRNLNWTSISIKSQKCKWVVAKVRQWLDLCPIKDATKYLRIFIIQKHFF